MMADFLAFGMQLSWPWSCVLHRVRAAAAVGGRTNLCPAGIEMRVEIFKKFGRPWELHDTLNQKLWPRQVGRAIVDEA